MRSFLVVWTIGNFVDSTDYYQVEESMDDAQALYDKVLEFDNLVVASITGVIESTDYEPYQFLNESEKDLEHFLKFKKAWDCKIEIGLSGQGDHSIIAKLPVNLCSVYIGKNTYLFGGISEPFYDRMVGGYHNKDDEENEEQWDRTDVFEQVEDLLIQKWTTIGIDLPHNHFEIREYIAEDIMATADPKEWHSGDFDIAFRRWIEAQSANQP